MIAADRDAIAMNTKAKFALVTLIIASAFPSPADGADDLPYGGWRLKDLDAIMENAPRRAVIIKVGEPAGFQANITVMIQHFPGSMKEYIDVSRGSFDQLFDKNWKFLSEKQNGEQEWFCEYVGTRDGKEYQFYCRIVKEGPKVYGITATALRSQWGSLGEKMRRHVDAFQR